MKTKRQRSPLPFLAAGLAFFLYGLRNAMWQPGHYIWAAVIALVVYQLSRKLFWKDQILKIELPPNTGDAQSDLLIREARTALITIRKANDAIADEGVSACIDRIEHSCREILGRLEEDTSLQSQLRTFLRYYLPTTVKLLDARAKLEPGKPESEDARETRARTERLLVQIDRSFQKQLEALDKNRHMDIQVEMDVLEGMLKSDGLSAFSERSRGDKTT